MSLCPGRVAMLGLLLAISLPVGKAVSADEAASAAAAAPTIVQNRDEPSRNRFQEAATATCADAGDCAILFPVVPRGKRVVVEHVSCGISIPASGTVTALILGSQQLRAVHEYLPLSANYGTDGFIYNVANVMTLVYFVPGEAPRIDSYAQGAAVSSFDCSLVGYATNQP